MTHPETGGPPWGVEWLAVLLDRAGLPADGLPWNSIWLVQLFLVCCLVFHLLERFGPRVLPRQEPGPFRRGWFADLVGAVVEGPVLATLMDITAVSLILLVPSARVTWGLDRWPAAAQFAVLFVVNDFARYWLHRWHHRSDLLWRLHRVHHSATQLSVLVSFRMHVLEVVPRHGLLLLPFKFLGVGAGPILALAALDLVKNFWQHANVRTYIGWGNWLISSPEQHWWHHSVTRRGQNSNYGSTLAVWDWLFGTIYWPRGHWPDRVGVTGIDQFPEGYLGRMVSIFRPDEAFQARPSPPLDTVAAAPSNAAGASGEIPGTGG